MKKEGWEHQYLENLRHEAEDLGWKLNILSVIDFNKLEKLVDAEKLRRKKSR